MSIIIGSEQMSQDYLLYYLDSLHIGLSEIGQWWGKIRRRKSNNYHHYIFSKGRFTEGLLQAQERGEVHLITLEDLYK